MASGKTTARIAANHDERHHEGFDEALEKALSQLSEEVGTGSYSVQVQFEAEVEVSNPGKITGYTITLSS